MEEDNQSIQHAEHECQCRDSPEPVDVTVAEPSDRSSKSSSVIGDNEEDTTQLTTEHERSPSPEQDNLSTIDDEGQASKDPTDWGNKLNVIRSVAPDEPLYPAGVDVAESYAGTSKSEKTPSAESPLSSWGSEWSIANAKTAKAVTAEDDVKQDSGSASESGYLANDEQETDDGSFSQVLDTGTARDIATKALDALPKESQRHRLPSSTPNPAKRALDIDSATPSPSPKAARSPVWRSLVPMPPPPGGYWVPNTTEEGVKNVPMCGPCRSGKKGRCFGMEVPCNRCKMKGYSKERCEGRVVFQFSPRSKRGGGDKDKKKLIDCEKMKRDSSGRFA